MSHHDLTMNDHQTWSMKLWYKYWILIFLNTVKQSKLNEEYINGWHPAQFYRNQKNIRQYILTTLDNQPWSKKNMLTMYDHETWSN